MNKKLLAFVLIAVIVSVSIAVPVIIILMDNRGGQDPRILWTFSDDQGSMFYASVTAIDTDGNIYIGTGHKWYHTLDGPLSDHYYLYCFNKTGSLNWKYDTGRREIRGGPVIGLDNMIYIIAENHSGADIRTTDELIALNQDGTLNWSYVLWPNIPVSPSGQGSGYNTPAIDCNGCVYAVGDNFTKFFGNNGTIIWEVDATTDFWASPTISNETVYFPCKNLYVYDINGTFLWQSSEPATTYTHKPSIDASGNIFFGHENGKFYSLWPNGTERWSINTTDKNAGVVRSNPAIDSDGVIYFGTKNDANSKFYALFPNGTIKWQYQSPLRDVYSSPTIGNDGNIYFGTEDQKVFCVNKTNGILKWAVDVYGDITWSSLTINDEGVGFIGTMAGRFYAIQTDSTGLHDCPWPKFGKHNNATAYFP